MKRSYGWLVLGIALVIILAYGGWRVIRHYSRGTEQSQVSVQGPSVYANKAASPVATTGIPGMTRYDQKKGTFFVGGGGMTLYTFDHDQKGVSNCNNSCAALWPPYLAVPATTSPLPSGFTVIARKDGSRQYAYNGMPLYYYTPDKTPGDTLGDGVGGVWHLATP